MSGWMVRERTKVNYVHNLSSRSFLPSFRPITRSITPPMCSRQVCWRGGNKYMPHVHRGIGNRLARQRWSYGVHALRCGPIRPRSRLFDSLCAVRQWEVRICYSVGVYSRSRSVSQFLPTGKIWEQEHPGSVGGRRSLPKRVPGWNVRGCDT